MCEGEQSLSSSVGLTEFTCTGWALCRMQALRNSPCVNWANVTHGQLVSISLPAGGHQCTSEDPDCQQTPTAFQGLHSNWVTAQVVKSVLMLNDFHSNETYKALKHLCSTLATCLYSGVSHGTTMAGESSQTPYTKGSAYCRHRHDSELAGCSRPLLLTQSKLLLSECVNCLWQKPQLWPDMFTTTCTPAALGSKAERCSNSCTCRLFPLLLYL